MDKIPYALVLSFTHVWRIVTVLLLVSQAALAATPLEAALDVTLEKNRDAVRSQQRVDGLVDEARTLLDEYRNLLQQEEALRVYNDDLARLVSAQKVEIARVEADINAAGDTRARIGLLLQRMVQALAEFVAVDKPFLEPERRARVAALKALLNETEVSPAEKFRRVMAAYQVEAEFGHTLEASTATIAVDGAERTFELLRIGRLALLGLSFDGTAAVWWNPSVRAWQPLPSAYNAYISRGLRVARKQLPPEFVIVPVAAKREIR